MIRFLMKKNLCDGWDNMLLLFVANCIFLGVLLVTFLAFFLAGWKLVPCMGIILVSCVAESIIITAFGTCASKIARFDSPHIRDFFKAFPVSVKDGFLFGIVTGLIIDCAYSALPFYFNLKTIPGYIICALLVWFLVFILLALQWFIPVHALMPGNFRRCFRKCFIILLDNTAFSVFMLFYDFVLLILSVILLGAMPSAAGITLAKTNALRLRLYKYEWLELNPAKDTSAGRRDIPWNELLVHDKAALGPRPLKSLFFPFKY